MEITKSPFAIQRFNVLGAAMVIVGDEDEVAGRVGEGLAREACSGYLLVSYNYL